jgi:hypothetical protein
VTLQFRVESELKFFLPCWHEKPASVRPKAHQEKVIGELLDGRFARNSAGGV